MLKFYDENNLEITEEYQYCSNPDCLGEPWCSAWGICPNPTMEDEIDRLMLQLSQQVDPAPPPHFSSEFSSTPLSAQYTGNEESEIGEQTSAVTTSSSLHSVSDITSKSASKSLSGKSKRCFAPVKTDKEIEDARAGGVPAKTMADTRYCVGLWDAWREYRATKNGDKIQELAELSNEELQYWLIRFVLEVRRYYVYTCMSCIQSHVG